MSGGVDSSVAAALLLDQGHDVVGVTMKLWGGPSDTGCCSVSDTDDARRVAQQLGIPHHVFNFSDDFDRRVVEPYVAGYEAGTTPNPCIECNRHIKFDRLLGRSRQLGFDAVATGHHARIQRSAGGRWSLHRGADRAKDQSYVLYTLGQDQLARVLLPVGDMTKAEVRARASALGLRTASKPDSQDVCFISRSGGRQAFLADRIDLHPGRVVDQHGEAMGAVPAVELVTVGQRRGLGHLASRDRSYVLAVDVGSSTVTVGPLDGLMVRRVAVRDATWVDGSPAQSDLLEAQMSAHGAAVRAHWLHEGVVELDQPVRRVAPGQSVVLYRGDSVLGGGIAANPSLASPS
jgi:tRNA-uridine 2-sulfurtransferase